MFCRLYLPFFCILAKTISNKICKPLPKPILCSAQSKNTLQQSRQREDLFWVEGERVPRYAFSFGRLSPQPNRSQHRVGAHATGARPRACGGATAGSRARTATGAHARAHPRPVMENRSEELAHYRRRSRFLRPRRGGTLETAPTIGEGQGEQTQGRVARLLRARPRRQRRSSRTPAQGEEELRRGLGWVCGGEQGAAGVARRVCGRSGVAGSGRSGAACQRLERQQFWVLYFAVSCWRREIFLVYDLLLYVT
jgi:hypothetical protein